MHFRIWWNESTSVNMNDDWINSSNTIFVCATRWIWVLENVSNFSLLLCNFDQRIIDTIQTWLFIMLIYRPNQIMFKIIRKINIRYNTNFDLILRIEISFIDMERSWIQSFCSLIQFILRLKSFQIFQRFHRFLAN